MPTRIASADSGTGNSAIVARTAALTTDRDFFDTDQFPTNSASNL
jgi:hypothetical protein